MGFYGHDVETKLKYRKRDNIYKNSTENCRYFVDRVEADSYKWWTFVKKINGKVVFNDYNYSSSTNNHQSAVRDLLKQLRIKIDLVVYTRASLSDSSALKNALENQYAQLAVAQHRLETQSMGPKARANRESEVESAKKSIETFKKIGAKLTKTEAREVYEKSISDYEFEAARTREVNRIERLEKKVERDRLSPKLKDLSAIDFDSTMNKLNNLEALS